MTNRTALVTGASRGIGRACALALSQAGARVALAARTVDQLEELAAEIRAQGREAFPVALDLASADSIKEATARTAKEFKIIYQKQPGQTPGTYTVDHSAGTFIFDPAGKLRVYVGYGQGADVFAHDIKALLQAQG